MAVVIYSKFLAENLVTFDTKPESGGKSDPVLSYIIYQCVYFKMPSTRFEEACEDYLKAADSHYQHYKEISYSE